MTNDTKFDIELYSKLTELDTQSARLPEVYQRAKLALSECIKIDECKEWANKAEALASYARQLEDKEMEKMCMRIKGRAIRRIGELLKEYNKQGRRTDQLIYSGAEKLSKSQGEVGDEAGLSQKQQLHAVRVANIPEDQFEEINEGDNPLSINKLAELGKRMREEASRLGFNAAIHTLGAMRRFAEKCKEHEPELIISGMGSYEVEEIREIVKFIQQWLETFSQHHPAAEPTGHDSGDN